MFEEWVEVFVDEEGYRLIIGMFFIPGGASPEAGLEDTEGVFRKGSQGGPLGIYLDGGSKRDTLRVGVGRKEVIGYTEGFIRICSLR